MSSTWLLALGIVLIIWIVLLTRSVSRLSRKLDEAESRLARRIVQSQGRITEISATVKELDFESRRARGLLQLKEDQTIGELLQIHPRISEVMNAYGMSGGGCSGPGLDESQSLTQACRAASLDPSDVLRALQHCVDHPEAKLELLPAEAKLHQIRRIPSNDA